MEEDKKSDLGILEKLAMITDATQELFPDGKSLVLFELNEEDYKKIQNYFRKIDSEHKKFVVNISGVEVVFILENHIKIEEKIIQPKKNIFLKFFTELFRKSSVSTVKQ